MPRHGSTHHTYPHLHPHNHLQEEESRGDIFSPPPPTPPKGVVTGVLVNQGLGGFLAVPLPAQRLAALGIYEAALHAFVPALKVVVAA